MFPPELERPTLAVIGLVQPLGAIMPISEMQARWATRVFKGNTSCRIKRPDKSVRPWNDSVFLTKAAPSCPHWIPWWKISGAKSRRWLKGDCVDLRKLTDYLTIFNLKSPKSCHSRQVNPECPSSQVRLQSQTHHPGWLYQLHGRDSRAGRGSTKPPEAPPDWSQAGTERDVWSLHTIPVSSQRSRKVGQSPLGHPHSVGESESSHADEAQRWAQIQEIIKVVSDSVNCRFWFGCLC